jgi:hypothetical protein
MPPRATAPVPKGPDAARWKYTGLVKRLITGKWREDGYKALSKVFSKARTEAMGELDMSRNPAKSVYTQLSVSYDEPPSIMAEGLGDVSRLLGPYVLGLLQRHELYVQAMRESLIRLDYEDGKVTARLVTPDEVAYCGANPKTPHILNKVEELRPRLVPDESQVVDPKTNEKIKEEWTWEVWDWSDPDAPEFKILSADRKTDRTKVYFPEIKPGDVPYKDNAGKGIFCYVLYHAETHGGLFDAENGRELVEGTLRIAVNWTGANHGFAEASWPQRNAIDLELQGAEVKGEGEARRAEITVAPTSVLCWQGINGKPGSLYQFEPAINIEEAGRFLAQCERDLAVWAGLAPSDLVASGDAQSGYSISVSRQGLRRKQAKVQPNLRMGDQLLLATAARLLNAYGEDDVEYPEDPEDYSIVYKGIPLSLEETKALIDQVEAKRAAGAASRIDTMIALEPGLTREQAKARLVEIAKEEAEIDALLAPFKPKPPPAPPKPGVPGQPGEQDPNNPDNADDGNAGQKPEDSNNPPA